jgi:hypothetical protein
MFLLHYVYGPVKRNAFQALSKPAPSTRLVGLSSKWCPRLLILVAVLSQHVLLHER